MITGPTRRASLLAIGAAFAAPALAAASPPLHLDDLERRSGGRLGVAVLDAATGRRWSHRGDERFPMCSTFKVLAAAAVLARVDAGRERLDRRIPFGPADLLDYAPATRARVAEGAMSVEDLCAAAVELSDNTAANLLLASIGGPPAVTALARSLGDRMTRLDRNEPSLNEALAGDPRDTTTPSAMVGSLRALLLGRALSAASRGRLTGWMVANTTGGERLRAGLPAGWRVGDKTGTGAHGSTNDIAILWPPGRAPMLAAVYLTGTTAPAEARNAILAEVGRRIARA